MDKVAFVPTRRLSVFVSFLYVMTICGVGISVMITKSCNDAVRVMTICGVGISIMMIKSCNDDI